MTGKRSQLENDVPMIRTVTPLEHHRLHIEFSSGSVLELNMENRLHTTRYHDLISNEVFCSAVTDGAKIIFDTNSGYVLEIFARETVDRAIRDPDGSMGILLVQPLEDGQLRLEMKNGSILMLDMEKRLHTIRYSSLKEPEVLKSARTDGENLFFGDVLKIDVEELTNLVLTIPPAVKRDETL